MDNSHSAFGRSTSSDIVRRALGGFSNSMLMMNHALMIKIWIWVGSSVDMMHIEGGRAIFTMRQRGRKGRTNWEPNI